MITNYLIYFNTLTKVEQGKQLSIILTFLFVLLIVVSILLFLKIKFSDETKENLLQKFLKKLWFFKSLLNFAFFYLQILVIVLY